MGLRILFSPKHCRYEVLQRVTKTLSLLIHSVPSLSCAPCFSFVQKQERDCHKQNGTHCCTCSRFPSASCLALGTRSSTFLGGLRRIRLMRSSPGAGKKTDFQLGLHVSPSVGTRTSHSVTGQGWMLTSKQCGVC